MQVGGEFGCACQCTPDSVCVVDTTILAAIIILWVVADDDIFPLIMRAPLSSSIAVLVSLSVVVPAVRLLSIEMDACLVNLLEH